MSRPMRVVTTTEAARIKNTPLNDTSSVLILERAAVDVYIRGHPEDGNCSRSASKALVREEWKKLSTTCVLDRLVVLWSERVQTGDHMHDQCVPEGVPRAEQNSFCLNFPIRPNVACVTFPIRAT